MRFADFHRGHWENDTSPTVTPIQKKGATTVAAIVYAPCMVSSGKSNLGGDQAIHARRPTKARVAKKTITPTRIQKPA